MLPMLQGGLARLQAGISGGARFSDLGEQEQDAMLEASQNTPFFQVMRIMTFAGFFGMSQYGGNRDGVGWRLLGMDPAAHAYTSPFGYYDARYLEEVDDA